MVDVNLEPTEELSYISLAASIQGMQISQTGQYAVKVLMGDEEMSEYPFVVNQKSS